MWLVIENEGAPGTAVCAVALGQGSLTVGRGAGCDLLLPLNRVSRRHVVLRRSGDEVTFEDLGATNGTLLNGARTPRGALRPGDRLGVGDAVLTVRPAGADLPTAQLPTSPGFMPSPSAASGVDLTPLASFVEALRQATGPKALLESLLQGLVQLCRAERGYVLLRAAPGSTELVPVASHALPAAEDLVAVSSTIYKKALQEGRALFVRDSSKDQLCLHAPSLATPGAGRSILCGPLAAAGEAFGVIYVDMPNVGAGFARPLLLAFELLTGVASEHLAAQNTRQVLLDARGRMAALNRLALEESPMVLGPGPAGRELQRLVEQAGGQDVSVLVTGDTGTGKEMVARLLHGSSSRREGPFVPVSCAALAEDIIEAELFGVEKGAFSGANEQRPGRFELASGGTLFLDEVGELPLAVQVKLLRVLQERTVCRVGGVAPLSLDFRLVCATNRDLEAAVADGSFRPDLFYRLNVFRIHLKPLAERPEDVLPLARHFLHDLSRRCAKRLDGFTPEAEELLRSHRWPGNVRELRNAIERAVVTEDATAVQARSLPLGGRPPVSADALTMADVPAPYEDARELFEQVFIRRCLTRHGGNIAAIARETGLARATIYRWLRKFGIQQD